MTHTEAYSEIDFRGDGPVTRYVAIMRTCEIVANGCDKEIATEALNDWFEDNLGKDEIFIPSEEY